MSVYTVDPFRTYVAACDWFLTFHSAISPESNVVAKMADATTKVKEKVENGLPVDPQDYQPLRKLFAELLDGLFDLLDRAKEAGFLTGVKQRPNGNELLEVTANLTDFEIEAQDFLFACACLNQEASVGDSERLAIRDFCRRLATSGSNWPEFRFKGLVYCFETESFTSNAKVEILLHAVSMWGKTTGAKPNLPSAPALTALYNQRKSNFREEAEFSSIFTTIAKVLEQGGCADDSLPYWTEALSIRSKQPPNSNTDDLAAHTLRGAILAPNVYIYDEILDNQAIATLAGNNKYSGIYKLAAILKNGTLRDFAAFEAVDSAVFETFEIPRDDVHSKLELICVAAANGSQTLRIKEMAADLGLKAEDVEELCVKAVAKNLMMAKVDQIAGEIHVTTGLQREFGSEQWNKLYIDLVLWQQRCSC